MLLNELGADVHRPRQDGCMPIHDSAKLGDDDSVVLLLGLRADIDSPGVGLQTILMDAAGYGCLSTVRLLLSMRADVHKTDCQGATAADMAVVTKHEDVLEVLVRAGGRARVDGRGMILCD